MKLTREEVQHIAELARLALSDEELALYQEQLSAILEHFERLQELDRGHPAHGDGPAAAQCDARGRAPSPLLPRGHPG